MTWKCFNADSNKIMSKISASLDRYISIDIHTNYMNIIKFLSNQDLNYQNMLSELQRFL